ncbi:hypothetical protein KC614_01045 [candidate division WWE3 bacterium]|uniref:Transcription regulator TrmB N-terminal domain-containing protein n=1 Tax=candidate division WWE3 bacterium TaxID=2053526 RepID=A0A955LK61_UNCKA|nr:hypothetical protein [candidate division WWE3 bacterium]
MADSSDNTPTNPLTLLKTFGVPEVAAKIYLQLASNPPLSINELSSQLTIPRTTIYDNVEKLIEFKLVERVFKHKSQKIKAYPIDTLQTMVDEQQSKADQLATSLDALKHNLVISPNFNTLTEVRYYQGVKGLEQLMWNTLKAKNDMVGYSTYGRREFVGKAFVKRYVEEFRRKRLKDRVIINPLPDTLDYLKKYVLTGDVHQQSRSPELIRYLGENEIYISGDTTIYNDTFSVAYWLSGEVVGIEIDNKEFVKTQRSIFESLWKTAKPISEVIGKRSSNATVYDSSL